MDGPLQYRPIHENILDTKLGELCPSQTANLHALSEPSLQSTLIHTLTYAIVAIRLSSDISCVSYPRMLLSF